MRIGLTSTTIEPVNTHGKIDGIGIYTKNLYDEFIKNHEEVTPYFFPQTSEKPISCFPNGKALALPYMSSTILSLITPAFISIHRNIKNNIDIFHATDHMIPKLKNIPTVATIHDALMFKRPDWHSAKFGNIKKYGRKKSLSWATHFITISNAMVPDLIEFGGIKEENISVVYNGVSPWWHEQLSAEDKQQLLQKFNLPPKFILFTGTLQQKKNLPRLIEAFLQLPLDIQEEYPLVISGRAGWGTEESLAAIEKLTSAKKGYWLDYVSIEELRALFQSASLYLYPSLHEGFGLTVLEAFASKTPIMTANVAALPEVADGAAYLIDPYSIDGMCMGMQTLLTHPELREELVLKGSKRVQDFSWEKCAKETLKVYQGVLD